jgi:hypothetical protein
MKILNVVKSFLVAIIISVFAIPAYAEMVDNLVSSSIAEVEVDDIHSDMKPNQKEYAEEKLVWAVSYYAKYGIEKVNGFLEAIFIVYNQKKKSEPKVSVLAFKTLRYLVENLETKGIKGFVDPRTKEVIVASLL